MYNTPLAEELKHLNGFEWCCCLVHYSVPVCLETQIKSTCTSHNTVVFVYFPQPWLFRISQKPHPIIVYYFFTFNSQAEIYYSLPGRGTPHVGHTLKTPSTSVKKKHMNFSYIKDNLQNCNNTCQWQTIFILHSIQLDKIPPETIWE